MTVKGVYLLYRATPCWCGVGGHVSVSLSVCPSVRHTRMRNEKYALKPASFFLLGVALTFIYGRITKILAFYGKSGTRKLTVMSDFGPDVEIWPSHN